MKFHEWLTSYEIVRRHTKDKIGPLDWYTLSLPYLRLEQAGMVAQIETECYWLAANRPYYSVYPKIVDSLSRVKLSIDTSYFKLPLKQLLVRFAGRGYECKGFWLRSILVGEVLTAYGQGIGIFCDFGERGALDATIASYLFFALESGKTIEDCVDPSKFDRKELCDTTEAVYIALRIVLAVCLLDQKESIVRPEVLSRHELKYRESGDEKYVQKAQRQGKIGWSIGRDIEVSPHIRVPHFGWRHTGVGGTIPRLVPIKGSVVNHKKIESVPTGYMGELK